MEFRNFMIIRARSILTYYSAFLPLFQINISYGKCMVQVIKESATKIFFFETVVAKLVIFRIAMSLGIQERLKNVIWIKNWMSYHTKYLGFFCCFFKDIFFLYEIQRTLKNETWIQNWMAYHIKYLFFFLFKRYIFLSCAYGDLHCKNNFCSK